MKRIFNFILSGLFILVFQSQSFALNRIIPCKSVQCNDTALMRKVAIKNTDNLPNQVAIVYLYNTDTETSQFFRVFRKKDLEFGGLNIVRARGPFDATDNINIIIKRVYDLEKDIFGAIGDPNPPPVSTLVGASGTTIGLGYIGVAFNLDGWSFVNMGSNVNYFGTTAWIGILNYQIMTALVNLSPNAQTIAQITELLNGAVNQQQITANQLGTTQLTSAANGLIFSAGGTFTNSNGESVTITNSNLPPVFSIKMTDGLVHVQWRPDLAAFVVDYVVDAEGNRIKLNEDGSINGAKNLPQRILVSEANLMLWKMLAARFALFSLAAQLENADLANGVVIITVSPNTK